MKTLRERGNVKTLRELGTLQKTGRHLEEDTDLTVDEGQVPQARRHLVGDDRSVKIRSLEAAKIMKIRWLVLGCIEAKFFK